MRDHTWSYGDHTWSYLFVLFQLFPFVSSCIFDRCVFKFVMSVPATGRVVMHICGPPWLRLEIVFRSRSKSTPHLLRNTYTIAYPPMRALSAPVGPSQTAACTMDASCNTLLADICRWSQSQRDKNKPKLPARQTHVLRHDRSPWNKHTDPPTSSHRTSSFVNFSNTDAYPQTVSWASIGLCRIHDFWYLAASQSRYHNYASIWKQRVHLRIVSGSHTHVEIGTQCVLIHMNCVPAPPSLQRLYVSPMHI